MKNQTGRQRAGRRGMGAGWKSTLVATSVGVVLIGWISLRQAESQRVDLQAAPAPVVIVLPGAGYMSAQRFNASLLAQQPLFAQPIARTRGS